MEGGITKGSEEVARVLEEIQNAMDRNTEAISGLRPAEEDKEDEEEEHKDEGSPTPGTGGDVFATPTASSPRTPIDSVCASLIAGTPIEPAYDPEKAFEMAHVQVTRILHHHGDVQNAQTAETIRKMLLRQTIRLREIYTPHATGRDAARLSKYPDLKADDMSASNLNFMLRLIRFFRGTGMPANSGSISAPAAVEIAEPAIHLLATLLLERGKIEEPGTPAPAPAPTGPTGPRRPSSAA
jgi:hypothetical protein